MIINNKVKKLVVSTPQGESGILHHDSRYSFNYGTGDRSCEASLLMPIRPESYSSGALPIVFAMNKPEGFLLQKIMGHFAKQGGLDDMKLLSIVGENQIGRLKYAEPEIKRKKISRPQIGLEELLKKHPNQTLFDFLVDTYLESGISGVQPKVMIPDADKFIVDSKTTVTYSDLIVKSGGAEYPFLTQNEFLCMEAARFSLIDVPQCWLSEDGKLFVMKRFDLNDNKPLGFEDMSVLMGKQPDIHGHFKYESSYENIAKVIQLFCKQDAIENKQKLFEYVALSVMVRNGDAHLKNFGLLYEHPDAQQLPSLSPLYDVVTTTVYPHINPSTGVSLADRTMALNLNKEKRYPSRKEIIQFGADICHVSKPQEVLERIGNGMSEALLAHREKIEPKFFDLMSGEWDKGRMSIGPDRFYVTGNIENIVTKGIHIGEIIDVSDEVVVQKTGRKPDEITRHDVSLLSKTVAKGEVLEIKYIDGHGIVSGKPLGVEVE